MEEPPALMQWITSAIAILGLGLAIFNSWRAADRDRVKLRVVPLLAKPVLIGSNRGFHSSPRPIPGADRLCIKVMNIGQVAVTLSHVGVIYRDSADRGTVLSPTLDREGTLPVRLEPKSSVTAYLNPQGHREAGFARVRCAFARTECGKEFTGKSPALMHAVALALNRAQ